MVRGDGHTYDLQVSAAPVRDGWGQIIAAVATFTDITARKSADVIAAAHRRWDKAMLAIGREAVSGNALDAILQSALDAVAAAAETPVGMIRLVEAETRDLVLAAERNLLPAYREVAARIKWGQYVAGQVAATGSLHVLEDVSSQPGLSRLSKLTDPPICSLIGVPLRAQGEVLGTLALGHPRPRRFGAADAMELLPFADMLAGAIRAEQLRAALRREAGARALLLRELNHRVRNNLAALIGLLHLAADSAGGGAADTLNAVAERVGHLANLHHMVDGKGGEPAELRELVATAAQSVLVPLGEDLKVRWCVDGASVKIPATQVIPVALVLTELFTNCMKHAFRGRSTGSVGVSIRRIGADVSVEVSDDGPGPGSGSGGLGLDISKALVRETLHGSFHLVPARDGGALVCVRFPLRPDLQRQGGEA
jgi:two-component sensor histidine kinase